MSSSFSDNRLDEKHDLFYQFKSTVEKIVSHHSYDVWSVHGGLQSLIKCLDAIFKHGNRPHSGILGPVVDYWLFIRGLRWIDPAMAPYIDHLSKMSAASPSKPDSNSSNASRPQHNNNTHGQQWIENSLKERCISRQFKMLISEENHVKEHYFDWAYLLDQHFTSATLTCMTALELNSSVVLADIPTSLFGQRRVSSQRTTRLHRALTGSSDHSNSSSTIKLYSDSLSESNDLASQNDVNKDYVDIASSSGDPLSASLKSDVISREKTYRRILSCSLSEQLTCKNNEFLKQSSYDHNNSVGMGAVTSLAACFAKPDSSWNDPDEDSPEKTPLLAGDQTSPYSKRDLKTSWTPLFCDSSDNECDSTDLAYLLSQTPPISLERTKADNYYFTMEAKSNQLLNSKSTHLPCPSSDEESTLQINGALSNTLPDLVISAEVSRSSKLDSVSTSAQNSDLFHRNYDVTMTDGAMSEKRPISKRTTQQLKGASACRRSQSVDYFKDLNVLQGDSIQSLDNSYDSMNSVLNPSLSLPHLNKPCSENDSPKSRSLMKYLKNQDLATCADLDKENAHFDFSEMLIGAIEQMKCRMQDQQCANARRASYVDSTEKLPPASPSQILSESYYSPIGSPTTTELDQQDAPRSRTGLPMSAGSSFLTSSSDYHEKEFTFNESGSDSLLTAESIAIGLMQTFSGHRHMSASEVDWLISEDDVPQKLLPLPQSTAIDPEMPTEQSIRIRGNHDWAPPRPQIIFNSPLKLKRKVALTNQNNRCAGCGSFIEKGFIKRLRYCEYTGKLFCTCCHDDKLSILPANVLQKFDFNKYKVSNFSYDVLTKIFREPLFNIYDINSTLYKKFKSLSITWDLRVQLSSLGKYLSLCRIASTPSVEHEEGFSKSIFASFPPHILEDDPHIYSLHDLEEVRSGKLIEDLKRAIESASDHVTTCELCRMKGFICEICRSDEVIFPHQSTASTCPFCKSCFHKKCFTSPGNCPKCARLRKRREMLSQISEE